MVCSSSLIVLLLSTNIIVVVQAHEEYKWEVPNGDQEIYGSYALGHTDPEGCSQINWFGMDFAAHGHRWTEELCKLDSDSDGQTNGFELGDPDCIWTFSSRPRFDFDISHPGIKDSISTRNMTREEIANLNRGLIAHLPITPHSGWISLGYAVFVPLGLAAIFSLFVNHIEFIRTSNVGKMLLQERVGQLSCCVNDGHCRSCRKQHKRSFRKRHSTTTSLGSTGSATSSMNYCFKCWKNEFQAYPWFIDLNIGEFVFFLAVSAGLIALICLKQGMKHRLANTLGQLASTLCFLVVLPASRTSIWVIVFGIPFERAIKWHRLFGKLFIGSVYLHLLVVLWRYGANVLTSQIQWGPSKDAPYPIFGLICGICITLIAGTSFDAIRRKSYELFYFSHLPLLMIISITAILHAPGSEYRGPVAVAFGLWGFDRIVGRCFLRVHKVVRTEVEAHKYKNLVKLSITLAKPVILTPGDYFNIYIPEIDRFENHPFTVSLQPQQNVVCFYIKTWGKASSWVERLRTYCLRSDFDANEDLKPVLEGPYGKLSIRISDYKNFFICSGGIGVTPMINIALDLHRRIAANNYNKEKLDIFVHFIWVVRDEAEFKWFADELCLLHDAKDFCKIYLYVTGKGIISNNVGSPSIKRLIISSDKVNPEMLPDEGMEGIKVPNTIQDDNINNNNNNNNNNNKKKAMGNHGVNSNYQSKFENQIQPIIKKGRPNFAKLFSNNDESIDEFTSGYYTKTAVLTCGPSNMVNNVQDEACKIGWPVHKETFLF